MLDQTLNTTLDYVHSQASVTANSSPQCHVYFLLRITLHQPEGCLPPQPRAHLFCLVPRDCTLCIGKHEHHSEFFFTCIDKCASKKGSSGGSVSVGVPAGQCDKDNTRGCVHLVLPRLPAVHIYFLYTQASGIPVCLIPLPNEA